MALSVRDFLDTCAQLEACVAELYYLFADQTAHNPELSALWRKSALEEENHRHQFIFAARLEKNTSIKLLLDARQADLALESLTNLISRVRQNPPEWQEALKLAIRMEEKLARFHSDTAITFADDSFNSLFKAMMAHDEQHVQSLAAYLDEHLDMPGSSSR